MYGISSVFENGKWRFFLVKDEEIPWDILPDEEKESLAAYRDAMSKENFWDSLNDRERNIVTERVAKRIVDYRPDRRKIMKLNAMIAEAQHVPDNELLELEILSIYPDYFEKPFPYDPDKFYPIDLIWEATRRNREYQAYYDSRSAENPDDSDNYFESRWNIFRNYCDYTIDIFTIKDRIRSGEHIASVHPYWHLHEKLTPNYTGVTLHECPMNLEQYETVIESSSAEAFKEKARHSLFDFLDAVNDKVVVTIDPTATDEALFKEIKRIKDATRESMKSDSPSSLLFYPTSQKIKQYIDQFKRYDDVVSNIQKEYNGVVETYQGAVLLPDIFTWRVMLPKEQRILHPCTQTMKKVKSYKEAYESAVSAIQTTPNVQFSFTRPRKSPQ